MHFHNKSLPTSRINFRHCLSVEFVSLFFAFFQIFFREQTIKRLHNGMFFVSLLLFCFSLCVSLFGCLFICLFYLFLTGHICTEIAYF